MKTCSTRSPLNVLRSLAGVGVAFAASTGAAQQAPPAPPEEIVVTSSIIAAAAPADRHGGVGHRLRGHRAARLYGLSGRAADTARHRRQQLGRTRQAHGSAHPRRGQLPHVARDRRRQGARPERAASRSELRQPAHDERSRTYRSIARPAGIHVRRRRRRRRQRHHETRRRYPRRPAGARIWRLFDAQDRRRALGRRWRRRLLLLDRRPRDRRFQRANRRYRAARRRWRRRTRRCT